MVSGLIAVGLEDTVPDTTDLLSGMPLTTLADVNIPTESKTMTTALDNLVKPGLQPLLAHLNAQDRLRFIALATQGHPITGVPRQDKIMLSVAEVDGRKYKAYRMAEGAYKLGDAEFTTLAQRWYDQSYELTGLYMKACRNAGWKVRTHKTAPKLVAAGYIWVSKR